MTPEQNELLRRLFTAGTAGACPADLLRANIAAIEESEKRAYPDWIDYRGLPMLPRQIGCLPTEAIDALVAFYLEHRAEADG